MAFRLDMVVVVEENLLGVRDSRVRRSYTTSTNKSRFTYGSNISLCARLNLNFEVEL
jgi:hypothetical protein